MELLTKNNLQKKTMRIENALYPTKFVTEFIQP